MVKVVVVGAGIGGLIAALSLHEVGCEVRVLEAAHDMRALGVGINLQPHAVRELEEMGLSQPLLELAITPPALVYFSKHGKQIWAEDRGLRAGYRWPQVSIHRGRLQQHLLATVLERLGPASVVTGQRAVHVDGLRVMIEAQIVPGHNRITMPTIASTDAEVQIVAQIGSTNRHLQRRRSISVTGPDGTVVAQTFT